MGLSDNNPAKFASERVAVCRVVRDEISFPLDGAGNGEASVNGAEFVIKAARTGAIITMKKRMTLDDGS